VRNSHIICLGVAILAIAAGTGRAAERSPILVDVSRPTRPLKMGDTPAFTWKVTNAGGQELKGLVVYPSLVCLKAGQEHPVDLEDWSGQRAVRIDRLQPGQSYTQGWTLRLIEAGRFGVALTTVDPGRQRPIVSDLLVFDVQAKPTLNSGRVISVAVGAPLLLLLLCASRWVFRR
jgi:hypothetical protein